RKAHSAARTCSEEPDGDLVSAAKHEPARPNERSPDAQHLEPELTFTELEHCDRPGRTSDQSTCDGRGEGDAAFLHIGLVHTNDGEGELPAFLCAGEMLEGDRGAEAHFGGIGEGWHHLRGGDAFVELIELSVDHGQFTTTITVVRATGGFFDHAMA